MGEHKTMAKYSPFSSATATNRMVGKSCLIATAIVILTSVGCEDDPNGGSNDPGVQSPGTAAANYNSSGFGIYPGSVSIDPSASGSVKFEAINGSSPFTWRVSRSDLGSISSSGLYTPKPLSGNNTVTVTDSQNKSVKATVVQAASDEPPIPTPTLVIIPSSDVLDASESRSLTFQVTGGSPPYSWSVSRTNLGVIVKSSGVYAEYISSPVIGVNNVTVRDSQGIVATASITQRKD